MEATNKQRPAIMPLYPKLHAPSAPVDLDDYKVNWNKAPFSMEVKWYNSPRLWNTVGKVFGVLAVPPGAAATWVFFSFTATPVVVLSTFAGLAFLTLSLTVSGIWLRNMTPSKDHPESKMKLRKEAGQVLDKRDLGYSEITERFKSLIDRGIITKAEINKIIGPDLHLSYPKFIKKHGRLILKDGILDAKNLQILKNNYLESVKTQGLKKAADGPDFKDLKLTSDEVVGVVIPHETAKLTSGQLTYDDFIERNGNDSIQYITDSGNIEVFWDRFVEFVLRKDLGVLGSLKKFGNVCDQFEGKLVLEEGHCLTTCRQALIDEILKKEINEHDYSQFTARNGFEKIQELCERDADFKENCKQAFMKMSYSKIISQDFEDERDYYEVIDEVKQTLVDLWADKSIFELVKDDLFLNSLITIFNADEWNEKTLSDTKDATVASMLKAGLFEQGLVVASDKAEADGPTLSERFEKEIQDIESLEALVERYSEDIFRHRLLNEQSDKLCSLLISYIINHSKLYLGIHLDVENPVMKIIDKYRLLNQESSEILKNFCKSVTDAQDRSDDKTTEIKTDYENAIKDNQEDLDLKIDEVLEKYEVKEAEKAWKDAKDSVVDVLETKDKIELDLIQQKHKLVRLTQSIDQLNTERNSIQVRWSFRSADEASSQARQMRGDIDSLKRSIKDYQTRIDQFDKTIERDIKSDRTIHNLEMDLKNLERDLKETKKDQDRLSQAKSVAHMAKKRIEKLEKDARDLPRIERQISHLQDEIQVGTLGKTEKTKGVLASLDKLSKTLSIDALSRKKRELAKAQKDREESLEAQRQLSGMDIHAEIIKERNCEAQLHALSSRQNEIRKQRDLCNKQIDARKAQIRGPHDDNRQTLIDQRRRKKVELETLENRVAHMEKDLQHYDRIFRDLNSLQREQIDAKRIEEQRKIEQEVNARLEVKANRNRAQTEIRYNEAKNKADPKIAQLRTDFAKENSNLKDYYDSKLAEEIKRLSIQLDAIDLDFKSEMT